MTILQLCADVLRPESIDDYWIKLMKEVRINRFEGRFEVRNFHRKMMTDALNQIEELEAYDALLRYRTTDDELLLMAPLTYGGKDDPGFYQKALRFFGIMADYMKKSITMEKLKQKGLSQGEYFELLRLFVRNVGQLSKDVADKEALIKPQKSLDELQKQIIQGDNVGKESYFKTPSKGNVKILERVTRDEDRGVEPSGRPGTSRDITEEESYIDEGMASLSLVTNYNNRFSKELSQDGASQRRTQEVKAPGNANPQTRVCFEYMKGRGQLGESCTYSHKPADCLRKAKEDFYKIVTSTWLPQECKKILNDEALDEFKQRFQREAGNVKVLSDDGECVESKHTEVFDTPGELKSNYSTPGSSVSKLSRLQQVTFRELGEEAETGEY